MIAGMLKMEKTVLLFLGLVVNIRYMQYEIDDEGFLLVFA